MKNKKSGKKKLSKYEKVLLATALINLIKSLIDLVRESIK